MIKRIVGYPLMALALTACVTINIYFPAAAAEEAARTIVRDVLKSEQIGAGTSRRQGTDSRRGCRRIPCLWPLA